MPPASDGSETTEWRSHLLEHSSQLAEVLSSTQRIAVIGIKPEIVGGPAYYVPEYLQSAGYEIVPVPVYYPDIAEILGAPVQRSLSTVIPPADMVLLFRRSGDVAQHVEEILAAKPRVVWMQLGIQDAEAAETFARAGIDVVQNKCLMIEHRNARH
ncbi:CoA-binding protein [Gemmatimonas groenlandica]|uniref:CoA-binding protein n=2 Tax=Gemmatimonas groenlandica TaxID=2732249 RepID=A0A6M4IX03_9BACT|nr:CoA-binding protein [Gemmatimonas groenlandica]